MRPNLIALAVLAGAGLAAAVAFAPTATPAAARSAARACFLPRQVDGFIPVDRDTVIVTIGPRRMYALALLGTCPDVDFSRRIGIRSTHGSSWVCEGLDAELIVPGPTGADRCPVTRIHPLSQEEAAAARKLKR
jgi:hypothetical protein